ncbi:MAG: hypothetical protein CMG55_00140 [Candidatus Marinimicrobia bacterium]|nr:hypothetical protein [Candidatus Neomarinimicrobiota bacterium]|tara:strand:+ start:2116 stop:2997 length:882 start_codon:yes stop_codon:yes gene_type:complete
MPNALKDYFNIIIIISFASLIALGGSHNSLTYNGYPILYFCMGASFLIHWIVFIPSFLAKTEKFYDITGTLAYLITLYLASALTAHSSGGSLELRTIIVIGMVSFWAVRLGIFLFIRVLKVGEDRRFREAKKSFSKYLVWWTMSALWVFLTTANALTLIVNNKKLVNEPTFYLGVLIWTIGILFEIVADEQKRRFQINKNNKDKFISSGLWSISRHPNYFGEIILWIGVAIISFPTLIGFQYVTLISPVFIYLLLTRISGVNLLEDRADKKWGELIEYKKYKENTPVLIPFLK